MVVPFFMLIACGNPVELPPCYIQYHSPIDSAYKALENLRIFNQRKIEGLWMLSLINRDPLFDSIRDEPEFQQIVRDVEAKYQAEHERVGKWLEENDML